MLASILIYPLLITAIIFLARSYWKRRKRNYIYSLLPGPKSQHWILGDLPLLVGKSHSKELGFHVRFLRSLVNLSQTHRKEGILRLWLANVPYVVLFSAEAMERVFTSQTLITKSYAYDLLHCWLGTGLLTSTSKKWKERRKLITPTFHYRILDDFIPVFDDHSKTFVKNLAKFAEKGAFDIVPHISLLTLDIICETAMGINIEAQKEGAKEYVDAIAEFGDIFMRRVLKPWLQNKYIFSLTSDGKRLKKILKILHDFSSKVVKQKKAELLAKVKKEGLQNVVGPSEDNLGRKKRKAFLDLLLQTQLMDNSIPDEGIREEVDTFMFEGHDTTATGISWTLYYLGRYPEVQQKAFEEIQGILGNDKDREITSQDLREMKYLECVLKESQRMSPSVPMFQRNATEEVNIIGYTVPRNATITLFAYGLHRDPNVFPNPDVFNPDRFLPENCVGRHPFAYVPFSAGARNCIGQKFAMNEIKVTICNALRNFIFESIDPIDYIKVSALMILRAENGIRMKITKRE